MTPTWSAPVRYGECDQQGIAFNSHYLAWADETMTAWCAATGHPYPQLLERGLDTRVVASSLEWSSSARWGELVEVDAAAERIGRTSFVVAFHIRVGDRACCTVRTTYVMTDLAGTPLPVPDDLRAAWQPAPEIDPEGVHEAAFRG